MILHRMSKPRKEHFLLLIPLLFCAISVIWSIWQDRHQYDPHHWGLMLSNARDLSLGLLPYKEIFIQYGILTTIIQSGGFLLLGKTLGTITIITSIFYASGLFLLYVLAKQVLHKSESAIYAFLLAFFFHPIVVMPWANYIAFPFLLLGLIFECKIKSNFRELFLSSIFFSLAVLSREGLFPAIVLIMFFCRLLDFTKKGGSLLLNIKNIICQIIGFLIPIGIFFAYLYINNLIFYWKILSIDLPKIYINNVFPKMQYFFGLDIFMIQAFDNIKAFDPRWVLLGIIFLLNIVLIPYLLFNINKKTQAKSILILSISSLVLLSSALHIQDIFRLATGSIIGLIPLIYVLQNFQRLFFVFFLVIFSLTITKGNSGNIYAPNHEQYKNGIFVFSPKLFYGQLWPVGISKYYENIQRDLLTIHELNCGIKFQINRSYDAFHQIISPFTQLQMAPFWLYLDEVRFLRPDLDITSLISPKIPADNLILIDSISVNDKNTYILPNKFSIFSSYNHPSGDKLTQILIPKYCKAK